MSERTSKPGRPTSEEIGANTADLSDPRVTAAAELIREAALEHGAASMADLGIEWAAEGMILRRPPWCDTDEKWIDYRERMADWWRAWMDGFTTARRATGGVR